MLPKPVSYIQEKSSVTQFNDWEKFSFSTRPRSAYQHSVIITVSVLWESFAQLSWTKLVGMWYLCAMLATSVHSKGSKAPGKQGFLQKLHSHGFFPPFLFCFVAGFMPFCWSYLLIRLPTPSECGERNFGKMGRPIHEQTRWQSSGYDYNLSYPML